MNSDPTDNKVVLTEETEQFICSEIGKNLRAVVTEEVAREEARKYGQFKWIIAFLGVVGIGTFGTLGNMIIDKVVDAKLESRIGPISESFEFIKLSNMASQLESAKSFSKDDKDAIMEYLRKTAKNDRIRNQKDFHSALLKVVEAFVSAEQSAPIDEIFNLYEREILLSTGLVQALLHHYGQDITARNAVPKQDTSLANFEKLERVGNSKSAELCLYYRMFHTHVYSGQKYSQDVSKLIASAGRLNATDTRMFLRNLFSRSIATNWQKEPDLIGNNFQSITRNFLQTYAQELSQTFHVKAELFKSIAENGISDTNVNILSDNIAKLKTGKT